MRALASNLAPINLVGPAVLSTPPPPIVIDARDSNGIIFCVSVGISGITFSPTNSLQFTLQDSEDGVVFNEVSLITINGTSAPASIAAGGVILSFTGAKTAVSLDEIGYIGGKKWLRAALVFNGTHATGTPVSLIAIKGHLARVPG